MPISFEESFLQNVFRILVVLSDVFRQPEDFPPIAVYEFVESRCIALSRFRYKLGFIEYTHVGRRRHVETILTPGLLTALSVLSLEAPQVKPSIHIQYLAR